MLFWLMLPDLPLDPPPLLSLSLSLESLLLEDLRIFTGIVSSFVSPHTEHV